MTHDYPLLSADIRRLRIGEPAVLNTDEPRGICQIQVSVEFATVDRAGEFAEALTAFALSWEQGNDGSGGRHELRQCDVSATTIRRIEPCDISTAAVTVPGAA